MEVLEIEQSIMQRLPTQAIKKLPQGRDKRFSKEAVVKFGSVSDRDMVKSAAFRLANHKDNTIRLEIPNHLLSQHRLLSLAAQRLGQANKNSHTNIKFDDDSLCLVLDYKVANGY